MSRSATMMQVPFRTNNSLDFVLSSCLPSAGLLCFHGPLLYETPAVGPIGGSQVLGFRSNPSSFGVVGGGPGTGSGAGIRSGPEHGSGDGSRGSGIIGSGAPPSLDLNEFPSLGSTSTSISSQVNTRAPYLKVLQHSENPTGSNSTAPFTIDDADFPSLPGSLPDKDVGSGRGSSGTPGSSTQQSSAMPAMSLAPIPAFAGAQPVFQSNSLSDGGKSASGSGSTAGSDVVRHQKQGIQSQKDGLMTNIPPGMIKDQFGMVGLLSLIRTSETDPKLTSLALGTDLMTLGLNLNAQNSLYSSWDGPWSDQPLRPHEIDYSVPPEYLINAQIRDKLAPIKLPRYGDDFLFFLFYMLPNDFMQLAAAQELYNRDWRYHKDERVWITRAPGMPPAEKTTNYERGTYYYFDPTNWRRVAKEFHLEYDRLENRPTVGQHPFM